jgi:hypothetical protein
MAVKGVHGSTEYRWNEHKEKRLVYLWYLGIHKGPAMCKFIEEDSHYCNNRKSYLPQLNKYTPERLLNEVVHKGSSLTSWNEVSELAQKIFRDQSAKEFKDCVRKLNKLGVKSPEQIYALWKERYRVIPQLSETVMSVFLKRAFLDKNAKYYSWRPAEVELYRRYSIDVNPRQLASIFGQVHGKYLYEMAVALFELKLGIKYHPQVEVISAEEGFSETE